MSDNDRTPANLPATTGRATPPVHWGRRAAAAAARVLFTIVGSALALLLGVAICAAIGLAVTYPNMPELSAITDYRPKLPLRVFSSDGVLVGE